MESDNLRQAEAWINELAELPSDLNNDDDRFSRGMLADSFVQLEIAKSLVMIANSLDQIVRGLHR